MGKEKMAQRQSGCAAGKVKGEGHTRRDVAPQQKEQEFGPAIRVRDSCPKLLSAYAVVVSLSIGNRLGLHDDLLRTRQQLVWSGVARAEWRVRQWVSYVWY